MICPHFSCSGLDMGRSWCAWRLCTVKSLGKSCIMRPWLANPALWHTASRSSWLWARQESVAGTLQYRLCTLLGKWLHFKQKGKTVSPKYDLLDPTTVTWKELTYSPTPQNTNEVLGMTSCYVTVIWSCNWSLDCNTVIWQIMRHYTGKASIGFEGSCMFFQFLEVPVFMGLLYRRILERWLQEVYTACSKANL